MSSLEKYELNANCSQRFGPTTVNKLEYEVADIAEDDFVSLIRDDGSLKRRKILSSQLTTKKFISENNVGKTTKTKDKFSSQSSVLSNKKKSSQEELNNDLKLLFISFYISFI